MIATIDNGSKDSFNAPWEVLSFEIINNMIIEIEGASETYYPFSPFVKKKTSEPKKNKFEEERYRSTPAYLKFLSINLEKTKEIEKFTNEYGFIYYESSPKIIKFEELTSDFFDNVRKKILVSAKTPHEIFNEESKFIGRTLSLESFKKESLKMRYIYLIWRALDSNDFDSILTGITALCSLDETVEKLIMKYINSDIYKMKEFLNIYGAPKIVDLINEKLSNTSPSIIMKDQSFSGVFRAKSLLDMMYAMLYMDITNHTIRKKCQNENCNEFFEVTSERNNKIFHDEKCRQRQAQREFRKREKDKNTKSNT